jgi:NADPH-dependent glutamate synthase beta subunit-like oxidoreductase
MPRRVGDRLVTVTVSEDERRLLIEMARRNGCHSAADFLRMAVNSMALESDDEAVFVEQRMRGRPSGRRSPRARHQR